MMPDQVASLQNITLAEISRINSTTNSPYGSLITISGIRDDLNQKTLGKDWLLPTNDSITLLTGKYLSSQWNTVVSTMREINDLHLNYAPIPKIQIQRGALPLQQQEFPFPVAKHF